ncbi:dehydrogenase [Flagelloscypha sp. PMI_526]|nr:dehydrogenase [Flagelloscypha sp. PMI_526]
MPSDSPVILISGCSTGFGRELALAALKAPFRVIATARRLQTLEDLKSHGATPLTLDVTGSSKDLQQFAQDAIAIHGRVDILVNNAGYLLGGAIEENTHETNLAQFNTNFFGLINLTNAFLPHMRERKSGTIVNISSQGGWLNISGAGMYCATKAAVDSITETWSSELKSFKIRVISVQLGSFRTSVATSGSLKTPDKHIEGYEASHRWLQGFQESAAQEPGDPAKAAKKLVDLVTRDGDLPALFPLGDDAVDAIRQVLERRSKEVEQWKDFGSGTSFE